MKVVFLDIDGVIAIPPGVLRPQLVAQLNRITDATGAVLVVHSSWRYLHTLPEIRRRLHKAGVTATILDVAPVPEGASPRFSGIISIPPKSWERFVEGMSSTDERAVAIERWLLVQPQGHIDGFVILDDDDALGHYRGDPRFVRTLSAVGLTPAHVDYATRWLGTKSRG